MTETRPPNDPEQMAMDAMWELWADAKSPAVTKEKGLAILKAFKVKPNVFEGEQYDINNVGTWYLGQVYEAVESENIKDLGDLVNNVGRYASKEFFGRRMHDVFEIADARNALVKKEFDIRYSPKDDWLDHNAKPHAESIFGSWRHLDHKKFEGRQIAVIKPSEHPDLTNEIVQGELTVLDGDVGSAIYHIKTKSGKVVELNSNEWSDYKVKDISEPTYRQILDALKKSGYTGTGLEDVTELKKNQSFKWLRPDVEKATWGIYDAVVTKAPENSALFEIGVGDQEFKQNTNFFISQGNRVYFKK